jgi:N-hydroxyarylamine O-acetyltransferase
VLDVPGYLRRLGLPAAAPTVDFLTELHRAHVERVAYNTMDIHLGRRTTVDPEQAAHRIVATGRGGYCFHLNGALSALLAALGFDVRRHRGWVTGHAGRSAETFANHLALSVHGLPTGANPGGDWFVDAGLGDALHEPLPLRAGRYAQGPFRYEIARCATGWQFGHDPDAGSFVAMEFEERSASMARFRGPHRNLSTKADSPFVQRVLAQRRDATGLDKLIGCTLVRVDDGGSRTTEIADREGWFEALADVFSLTLTDAVPRERDRLWQRAYESHLAWKGRP